MKRIEVGTALAYIGAGLCALPAVKAKKLPPLRWKRYQTEFPDEQTVREWFATPRDAVCVLTGAISGGLECIDFDHKAAFCLNQCSHEGVAIRVNDKVIPGVTKETFASIFEKEILPLL